MAISDVHEQYSENLSDWELVTDSLKESRIKKAEEKYLPRTSGQKLYNDTNTDDAPYQAYKLRARFPLLVNPAVTALTGIAHKTPPELIANERLVAFTEDITPNAEPLEELSRQTVRNVLLHGRYGLLTDVDDKGDPYIAGYNSTSIINWKTAVIGGRQLLTLVVLKETEDVSKDEFKTENKDRYRVLRLKDGIYTSTVYDDKFNQVDSKEAISAKRKPLNYIPFVIVGSIDLTPDVDESPLLPLAKTCINIYQLDADYRQSLHMTAEPTPVIFSDSDMAGKINSIGSSVIWNLDKEAKAQYLEVSGNGIEAQRKEIQDEYARAKKIGGEISEDSRQAESGEAIKLRMFSRHASLHSVATTTGAGIEQSLRFCAELTSINGETIYKPNLDFSGKEINEALLAVIDKSVNSGNLPKGILFEAVRSAGLTEMDNDELLDEIDIDPIGLGPVKDDEDDD